MDKEKFFSDDSWSERNKKKKWKRFYQVRNSTSLSHHYGRNWGLIRNEQLLARLEKRLEERNAYQGEFFTIFAENNVE